MRSRRESARPRPSQLLTRSRPQRWSPKTRHHRRRAEDFTYRTDRVLLCASTCSDEPRDLNSCSVCSPRCKFPDCHGDGSAQHAAVRAMLSLLVPAALALNNGLGRTPARGWNAWNSIRCEGLNENLIREVADAMVR